MRRARVLFLCIGNSCRSQMAEGFARRYGSDVMEALSAGLYPAVDVASLTKKVMLEKNIDVSGQFPKGLDEVNTAGLDVVINMSGQRAPASAGAVLEDWVVRDPIGLSEDVYREVANEIEQRVMRLVLGLRAKQSQARPAGVAGPLRRRRV